MAHSDFIQLIDNNNNVLPTVDKAILGKTTILRTGFAQPIAENEEFGDELVVNGDCETASVGWGTVGTPTSQARSSEQKKSGTYSWKAVLPGGGEAGFGQTVPLVIGALYKISFYYMKTAGVLSARLGSGASSTPSFTLLNGGSAASMTEVVAYYIAEDKNDGKLQFYHANSATVYVDDVSIKQITSTPQKSMLVLLSTPTTNAADVVLTTSPNALTNGFTMSKSTSITLNVDIAQARFYVSGTAGDVMSYFIGWAD